MKRSQTSDEVGDSRRLNVNTENASYNTSYGAYPSTTPSNMPTTNINQPLPGQPPLPPMPPPSNAPVPPPSPIFPHGITSQVSVSTWTHHTPPIPFAHPWQWMPLAPQSPGTPTFQREIQPIRGSFSRRERQGWNNNYNSQRSNFHRKNRRMAKAEQPATNQFDMDVYNMAAATNPNLFNNIAMLLNQKSRTNNAASSSRAEETSGEPEAKEDTNVKRLKHRKPMSLSYPRRPWNREHAERALSVEMEYNKNIKGQSLIIKFPDPDLNKDIVRNFHPGIQNIHFQSPSGPRYCFIQMDENINIDEAIKELEKIKFGVGYLKVERKSLRDEDNTMPEEIDPYTLYIGNLPESVNVNEVKSKFPTAVRIDVGYAQKMRNTRYAFIRYNSVEESIEAYKSSHDLMWDTRSIIVRFLRQRGNTCLPGETKANAKKAKESSSGSSTAAASAEKNPVNEKSKAECSDVSAIDIQQENNVTSTDMAKSDDKEKLPETSENLSTANVPTQNETEMEDAIIEIKEEPVDYEEMDDNDNDDEDDDDDDDDDDNVDNKWRILIPKIGYIVSEDHISTSDHLDEMFTDLEHAVDDIDW